MGGMGIFQEARPYLPEIPARLDIHAFRTEVSGLLFPYHAKWMAECRLQPSHQIQRNQRRFTRDPIASRQETNEDKRAMVSNTIVLSDQAFGWKAPFVHGALLVALYLSPIQYFIIPGVSRLKRSDGWCVLTIHHTVHRVHTAKGQCFFLILSIDWKDWSKQQAVLQKKLWERTMQGGEGRRKIIRESSGYLCNACG